MSDIIASWTMHPADFEPLFAGLQTAIIDGTAYECGDRILLLEINNSQYTGRIIVITITHVSQHTMLLEPYRLLSFEIKQRFDPKNGGDV